MTERNTAYHEAIANEHLRDVNPKFGSAEGVAQGIPVVEDDRLRRKVATPCHESVEQYVQIESHMLAARTLIVHGTTPRRWVTHHKSEDENDGARAEQDQIAC